LTKLTTREGPERINEPAIWDNKLNVPFTIGARWLSCSFSALRPEGGRFESHCSLHVGGRGQVFHAYTYM